MMQAARLDDYIKKEALKNERIEKPGKLYSTLCDRFPLHTIKNKNHHAQALAVLLKLSEYIQKNDLSRDKKQILDYMDALGLLVEEYERKHYAADLKRISGVEILEFLMEQHSLKQSDLAKEFGGQSTVSDILAGKRKLNSQQIEALSARFGISPAVFF